MEKAVRGFVLLIRNGFVRFETNAKKKELLSFSNSGAGFDRSLGEIFLMVVFGINTLICKISVNGYEGFCSSILINPFIISAILRSFFRIDSASCSGGRCSRFSVKDFCDAFFLKKMLLLDVFDTYCMSTLCKICNNKSGELCGSVL